MDGTPGPQSLRALGDRLLNSIEPAELGTLERHADTWEAERREHTQIAQKLKIVEQQLEVLERDRKWWQENAIKRRKRAERRRAGQPPDEL